MIRLFKRPPAAERDKANSIKQWVRTCLALPDEATVSVNEIDCGDAACPGIETVILVMRKKQATQAYRVKERLLNIGESLIAEALRTQNPPVAILPLDKHDAAPHKAG